MCIRDRETEKDEFMKPFREAAELYKDKMNFAWVSLEKDPQEARMMTDYPHEQLGSMFELNATTDQPALIGIAAKEFRALKL